MSRTVCSWCKAPLVLKDDILVCSNTDCPACDEKYLHEELIRTRKALEIAVDALKSVRKCLCEMPDPSGATIFRGACESATTVKKVLEQITALEQKE